jgi:hypothetical protein
VTSTASGAAGAPCGPVAGAPPRPVAQPLHSDSAATHAARRIAAGDGRVEQEPAEYVGCMPFIEAVGKTLFAHLPLARAPRFQEVLPRSLPNVDRAIFVVRCNLSR